MQKDINYPYLEDTSSWNAAPKKQNYLSRLIGTAIGFSLFGVGGLILCLSAFPIISLVYRNQHLRRDKVRHVISYTFKIFLNMLEFLGVIEVKTTDLEKVKKLKGTLIVCNHPSLLDVVVIMAHLKSVQCVVKKELWKNPFLGGVVRAADYIRNDLDTEQFYKDCVEQLKRGENIIIFPEGTRSTPGTPLKLQRSLGNLAILANVDIQALIMDCHPSAYTKGEKWYKIPVKRPLLHLNGGQFFPCSNYRNDLPRSLGVRALMRDIQHYYNRHLGYE
jgi:1-acyl-sn-glycerol-3-phosphate acyltransferase